MDITELQNRHDTALALVKEVLTADTELTYFSATVAFIGNNGNVETIELSPDADIEKLANKDSSVTAVLVERNEDRVFTIMCAVTETTEWDVIINGERGGVYTCYSADGMQALLSRFSLNCQ